jgi:hypothetical protein
MKHRGIVSNEAPVLKKTPESGDSAPTQPQVQTP